MSSTATPSGAGGASGTGTAGAPADRLPDDEARALADVLSAEEAAVYAYGVVGAQCDDAHRPAARAALQRHSARRDLLAGRLSAAGITPAPAAPAYVLPFAVATPAAASALAAHVESGVAAVNADLVAAAAAPRRLEASRWLAENALAARHWGARPTAFPGLPERADRP